VRLHEEFEWNPAKAKSNVKKHRVSFEEAARVLADEHGYRFHIEDSDDEHSGEEERWITTGSHPGDRQIVMRIAWTIRYGSITRIISARFATPFERRMYDEEIKQREGR
jgi:uncharacterized protein